MKVEFGVEGNSATATIDIATVRGASPNGRVAAVVTLARSLRRMADQLLELAVEMAAEVG